MFVIFYINLVKIQIIYWKTRIVVEGGRTSRISVLSSLPRQGHCPFDRSSAPLFPNLFWSLLAIIEGAHGSFRFHRHSKRCSSIPPPTFVLYKKKYICSSLMLCSSRCKWWIMQVACVLTVEWSIRLMRALLLDVQRRSWCRYFSSPQIRPRRRSGGLGPVWLWPERVTPHVSHDMVFFATVWFAATACHTFLAFCPTWHKLIFLSNLTTSVTSILFPGLSLAAAVYRRFTVACTGHRPNGPGRPRGKMVRRSPRRVKSPRKRPCTDGKADEEDRDVAAGLDPDARSLDCGICFMPFEAQVFRASARCIILQQLPARGKLEFW